MASRGDAGLERLKEKLEKCYQCGDFYHVHQMYKTLHFRLKRQNRWSELQECMFEGSKRLLSSGQANSGADLALTYLDGLNSSDVTTLMEDEVFHNLATLHSMMLGPERSQFTSKCLEFSIALGRKKGDVDTKNYGHPTLHKLLAENYWKEKNYGDARYHFMRSLDGTLCGNMLIEYHLKKGYKSEVDLFIAQTVLQCLCLNNRKTAVVAFFVYTQKHPNVTGPPFVLPLLNFTWFLLLAVETQAKLSLFNVLCEKYKTSLDRDPNYCHYLERIGQIFFAKQPVQGPSSQSGLFGNFLNQFMTSMQDDDDSDELGILNEDVD